MEEESISFGLSLRLSAIEVTGPKSAFFLSTQAQIIAQAIGQAFGVAYRQFLQENGAKSSDLRPADYSDYLESQELYNGDLAHFSDSQNIREVSGFDTQSRINSYRCTFMFSSY